MQAQAAGKRRLGGNWVISGILATTIAITGVGIAVTQLVDAGLPWTSTSAPISEPSQPYIRPADRPASGPVVEPDTAPTFNRPTEDRTGYGTGD